MKEQRRHRPSGPTLFRTAAIVALVAALLWGDGGGVQVELEIAGCGGTVTNYTNTPQKTGLRVWDTWDMNAKGMVANDPFGSILDHGQINGRYYQDLDGFYYQELWPSVFQEPLEAGERYDYQGKLFCGDDNFTAAAKGEPLLKVGTCNAVGPRADADPISVSELAALLQTPAYYDKNYRYAGGDRLGSHGGAYSGGIFDTFFGETQFQFAIPGTPEETGVGAVGVSGKWMNNCGAAYCASAAGDRVAFDVNRGGQGAMFWMALVANQEYFGIDLQTMIAIGMKESNLLTNNNTYTAAQDIGNLTPFAIDQGYGMMNDMVPSLPSLFQYGINAGDGASPTGLPYWRYTGDAAGRQGLSQEQWQDMISNDGSMAINAVLSSGAFWHIYNHVLSSCSDLGYKQLLENSSSGYSDPAAGFCLVSLLYNKGAGTSAIYNEIDPNGKLSSLLNNPNACDTINRDIAGNIGGYAGPVLDNARRLISASIRAATDSSVVILDRWITLDQVKRFWFGQKSLTDATPGEPTDNGHDQIGGLLMHLDMSTEERQAIWNDVEAAFNLQAQKWGGGKISLRYDWISNLRVAKNKVPASIDVTPVYWIQNVIKTHSSKPYDGSGQRLDKSYPFIESVEPVEATDPEGFAVEVHALEPRHALSESDAYSWDRGIANVEWTVDTLWRRWSSAKVDKIVGNVFDVIYKVDLGKSDLGAVATSGGWLWVRAVDSCGNAVASKVLAQAKSGSIDGGRPRHALGVSPAVGYSVFTVNGAHVFDFAAEEGISPIDGMRGACMASGNYLVRVRHADGTYSHLPMCLR